MFGGPPQMTPEELDELLAATRARLREQTGRIGRHTDELLEELAERYPEDWGEQ
ncbi:hypothetical protein [Planobispora longispora]|uniref:Uncharacterized protein n=1 Tax=Planobispora longispora TaxID=28887 RepID=A0A8J3RI21_9ACTN|nr:hypothetical protein [Planobispora longispora]BFE85857.1 hypothetical protein GCM10020093_084580 [Planobispora longispora]GIH76117.1 hypothetical protein Plo01_25460 [Planobispora longispora]